MGIFASQVFGSEDGPVFGDGAVAVAPIDPYGVVSMIFGFDYRRNDLVTLAPPLVTQVLDTEQAFALVQATDSARPSYGLTTGFTFDGARTLARTAAAVIMPDGAEPWHFFGILDDTGGGVGSRYTFGWGGSGANFAVHILSLGVSGSRRFAASVPTGASAVIASDTAILADGRHMVEAWGDGTSVTVKIDEGPEVTAAVAQSISATSRIRISGLNTSSNPANGWIGKIWLQHLYNAIQTGSTRAGLRQYYRNAVMEIPT